MLSVFLCPIRHSYICFFFFFTDTATTEIYTLSLHDALPISHVPHRLEERREPRVDRIGVEHGAPLPLLRAVRSEEHTSELQSLTNLVCRLLLEKKNKKNKTIKKIKHKQDIRELNIIYQRYTC